jgi:phosphatidate phosphatase PAH1
MNKKIICFDIDGVICNTKNSNYTKSIPNKKTVKLINSLFDEGYKIKIFTARYMGRNLNNSKKAYKEGYKKTFTQLKKWNLKFDELILGKPTYDIFIDDKSLGFKKNWIKSLKDNLEL